MYKALGTISSMTREKKKKLFSGIEAQAYYNSTRRQKLENRKQVQIQSKIHS